MRYRDQNASLTAHITTLRAVIGVLVVFLFAQWWGWVQAKKAVRIHIPPDMRSGAVVLADELLPPHVYAFAQTIFQQGNHWPDNGETDYGLQIFRLSPYYTPRYRAFLQVDLELRGKRGELDGRIRSLQLLPGHGYEERRVEVVGEGVWLVWLDVMIKESVRGMPVKHVQLRYPLRVVRYDVDVNANPWGLALDGYAGDGPRHLTPVEIDPETR